VEGIMKQYWMKIKYAHDGVERWELTSAQFANEQAVLKGYEARTRSMGGTILAAKPHEQFEFKYDKNDR
jgi:hypothetical protein